MSDQFVKGLRSSIPSARRYRRGCCASWDRRCACRCASRWRSRRPTPPSAPPADPSRSTGTSTEDHTRCPSRTGRSTSGWCRLWHRPEPRLRAVRLTPARGLQAQPGPHADDGAVGVHLRLLVLSAGARPDLHRGPGRGGAAPGIKALLPYTVSWALSVNVHGWLIPPWQSQMCTFAPSVWLSPPHRDTGRNQHRASRWWWPPEPRACDRAALRGQGRDPRRRAPQTGMPRG